MEKSFMVNPEIAERKKEILNELRELERREKQEGQKHYKEQRRRFDRQCRKWFGVGITRIEEALNKDSGADHKNQCSLYRFVI